MIYCIWYPSGGFGHFINAVLTLHGDNFVRPTKTIKFSETGDLHDLDLVLPKYYHNCEYKLEYTDPSKNYCVLVDNGINNNSTKFKNLFIGSKIIKICYNDRSWPIIAKTLIVKAMHSNLNSELPLGSNWPSTENWAVREKYFLYLRDHPFRYMWQPSHDCDVLYMDSLFNYTVLMDSLSVLGIDCDNFETLHQTMLDANLSYFSSVFYADKIIKAIETNQHIDISDITDLWDQAVVNYFIQIKFGIEIPANTHADWFTNTQEINKLL